jgi:hypothetical protein
MPDAPSAAESTAGSPAFPAQAAARAAGWLQSAPYDLVLAWGWVPFYLWICTTPLVGSPDAAEWRPAFKLAALVALAVNFVHRHFVYFLFFGDEAQRKRHPRALWLAPLVALVVVASARTGKELGARSAWDLVLFALGAWNVWHVLLQRHGLARAYAARAGGGLEERAHGRRDLALAFSLTALTAAAVVLLRQDTFAGPARRAWAAIPFLAEHADRQRALFVVVALVAAALVASWSRHERAAATRTSRLPRLSLWGSTAALLLVFVLHGPVVGYIVFGFAHSLEYILFVHMYSRRRLLGARGGAAALPPKLPGGVRALGQPLLLVLVSAGLLVAFAGARQVWSVPLFVVYYTTTSFLHYFYDGIVWKMRRPEVRAPIVSAPA